MQKTTLKFPKSVNDFPMSETFLDSEHVAVLTKPHAEKIEMRANILPEVQIFRTSRDKVELMRKPTEIFSKGRN